MDPNAGLPPELRSTATTTTGDASSEAGLPPELRTHHAAKPPPPPPAPPAGKGPSNVDKAIDLLTRMGQSGATLRLHGISPALDVLQHGETPEQYGAQGMELSRRQATASIWAGGQGMTDAEYAALPQWSKNIGGGAQQAKYDPLTYPGGAGVAREVVEKGLELGMPLLMRAWQAGRLIPQTKAVTEHIGGLGALVHGAFTTGGSEAAHVAREVAKQGWNMDAYHRLQAISHMGDTLGMDLSNQLSNDFERAIRKLSDRERLTIFRAIHGGYIDKLAKEGGRYVAKLGARAGVIASAARNVQNIDRTIPAIFGSPSMQAKLAKLGYTLPAQYQRFATNAARGYLTGEQFMAKHIPLPWTGLLANMDEGELLAERLGSRPLRKAWDRLRDNSAQFLARTGAGKIGAPGETAAQKVRNIEEMFRLSFRRAGRLYSGASMRDALAQQFGVRGVLKPKVLKEIKELPEDVIRQLPPMARMLLEQGHLTPQQGADMIARMRGAPALDTLQKNVAKTMGETARMFTPKTPWIPPEALGGEHTAEILHGVGRPITTALNLWRSLYFATPVPHIERMFSLMAGGTPEAIPGAIGKFVQTGLGMASPARKAKVFGEAYKRGVVGARGMEQSTLDEVLHGIRPEGRLGKAVIGAGKTIAKIPGAMGAALWGSDEAMRAAMMPHYLAKYKDPWVAAYHLTRDMVDYSAKRPVSGVMRALMTFPTWGLGAPLAVARTALKNPHIAATLARTAPELYGAPFPSGPLKGSTLGAAAAGETVKLLSGPAHYLTNRLAPIAEATAMAAMAAAGFKPSEIRQKISGGAGIGSVLGQQVPGVPLAQQFASMGGKHLPGVQQRFASLQAQESPQQRLLQTLLNINPPAKPHGRPRIPWKIAQLRRRMARMHPESPWSIWEDTTTP